jgi:hypothetical protein
MRYVYSVVRFVPDPARGEFVNVGAIAGSEDSSEWLWRQVENPVRARAVDDRKALEAVWAFLDRVGREMDDYERAHESLFEPPVELSEEWLQRLYAEHRNVVQLSPPAPMVASTADEALDRVLDQMVLDPALRRVPDQELVAEQVKAWGWTVRDVQQGGGTVRLADGSQFDVGRDVDVEVVYVPPAPGQDAPAMRDARHVFEALEVTHAPLEGADLVGERARDLLIVAAGVGRLDISPGGP